MAGAGLRDGNPRRRARDPESYGRDAPSVSPTVNIDPKRVLLLMPKWAGPFLLLELQQVLKRSNQFIMVEPAAWQIFLKKVLNYRKETSNRRVYGRD